MIKNNVSEVHVKSLKSAITRGRFAVAVRHCVDKLSTLNGMPDTSDEEKAAKVKIAERGLQDLDTHKLKPPAFLVEALKEAAK